MNFPFDAEIIVRARQKEIRHLIETIVLVFTVRIFAAGNYEPKTIEESSYFSRRACTLSFERNVQMFGNSVVNPLK